MFHYIFQMFPELSLVLHTLIYMHTKKQVYAEYVCGVVFLIFLGVIAKKLMGYTKDFLPHYVVLRPRGAFGCNDECKKSNDGDVGLPSIHSMIAGYYSFKYKNPLFVIFALSRLSKLENPVFYHSKAGCHTLPQIIVGYVLGIIIASRT